MLRQRDDHLSPCTLDVLKGNFFIATTDKCTQKVVDQVRQVRHHINETMSKCFERFSEVKASTEVVSQEWKSQVGGVRKMEA